LLNIDKCVTLNLYGQNLKVISTDIIKLINLRELNIGGNPELDLKNTFMLLATLKSLEYLSIEDNKLKNIPKEISQLINIKHLNASGNKLKKLPSEICSLSNLEVLYIYSNRIKRLPDNLHHLKNLKSLNCNANFIRQLPDSISQSNLKKLQLGANRRINIERVFSALFFCKSLDTLVLYNCNIAVIPKIIYHQVNLKYLDLSANPFSTIPLELGKLTNLTTLKLSELIYLKYDKELHRLLPETTFIR
jgi:Leucine-rich repeat (LRR) protein